MLKQSWETYRGWAKRARGLQAETDFWNVLALVCVVVAALCGAATTIFPKPSVLGPSLAIAAALASAAGAYFGKTVVGSGKEAGWAQARATAEAIKSECFRYTARAGPYSQSNAVKTFLDRIDAFAETATDAGLAPSDDPIPAKGDERMPTDPMAPRPEDEGAAKRWYVTHRIDEQVKYYRKGQEKNEVLASRLWWIAFLAGLAAVLFGAIGAYAQAFAPWIGSLTTIAAAVAAYGLVDRRKYLIASYAGMQVSLKRIKALDEAQPASLADLVTETEDLLDREHGEWQPHILGTLHKPPPQAEAPGAVGSGG
jgi:SMODS and SLOG-associating 2TM effector domain 1/SMODS and SLOG-associating 2TM effector domain 3